MTAGPSQVIGQIEKDLREMWSVAAAPGELPKTRACTMNLVVVASGEELADRYLPTVDEVTRTVPARAIVVALDPHGKDALEGDASAVCALDDKAAICSERVRLVARGAICARVHSAVEALSVPEMPTTLVWLGRVRSDDPVFAAVAEGAERVIVDTEQTSLASLVHLARWARADEGGIGGLRGIADLAWTRLSVWQELAARFFDQAKLRELSLGVTKLAISQACDPGAQLGTEGALFIGWLATRLGWKLARLGEALRFARPDGGAAQVSLAGVTRPAEVSPGALARVALEAERGGVTLRGAIERELASGHEEERDQDVLTWRLAVEGASGAAGPANRSLEQRVRLPATRGARLLEQTLRRPRQDPALLEAVTCLEPLLEDDLRCG